MTLTLTLSDYLQDEQIASLLQLTRDEPEAADAVFATTPLDILSLARLRREQPEYALALADAAGREFDRRNTL